jgi:hypothetical protein
VFWGGAWEVDYLDVLEKADSSSFSFQTLSRKFFRIKCIIRDRLDENAVNAFTRMIRIWQMYSGPSSVFHQEIDFNLVTFWPKTDYYVDKRMCILWC